MDDEKTLDILKALADGVNPYTGEEFPRDSLYQDPRTVRALLRATQVLEFPGARRAARSDLPANTGKKWSTEEEQQLAAAFDTGKSIKALAELHKRTYGSIEARLAKLGKIELPEEQLRYRQRQVASDG
ncbi:MAG: hypothetical protein V3T51_05320 [Gammaproteobacteria bacterium]